MLLVNSWLIKIFSTYVGKDNFGNLYYHSRRDYNGTKKKRYVVYNNTVEPTTVSPKWYAWLHYLTDEPPMHKSIESSRVNYTGTKLQYNSNLNNNTKKLYNSWHP